MDGYATAPPLAAGDHDVVLQQGQQVDTKGTIAYSTQLLPSVQGAVAAHVVVLRELAWDIPQTTDEFAVKRLVSDRDMCANAVDLAVHFRAEATGERLETTVVDAVWLGAAAEIESLESVIRANLGIV
jgi:hypothetical protein